MKILQLVTKRQYRGAEVFAANLSSELLKLGHKIVFAGLYKNEDNVLHVTDAVNMDLSEGKDGNFSPVLVLSLIKLVKQVKPDVIQCNGSDTLKYMVAASLFTNKVPIVYRNISMISEWLSNKPKKILYKNLFKRVDHVSSVGEEAIDDFIRTFNYPKQQTSVIRRGIPLHDVKRSGENLILHTLFNFKETDKFAIHIGNFSPEKNHRFLLDIFTEIKNEKPHLKLICVGNGITFHEIQKEIKARELEDTVFLTGFRKDIPELLAEADCCVLCSKVEGVPGVILEAAAQKKPAVATNVGGVFEVLKNGETGYMIDDFDKKEFKDRLLELIGNPVLREEMGEKAYHLVQENFNPVKNAIRFETLYQQLASKNS